MKKKLGLYALITLALAGVGASFSGGIANNVKKADAATYNFRYYLSIDSDWLGGNKDQGVVEGMYLRYAVGGIWRYPSSTTQVYYVRGRKVVAFDTAFSHNNPTWVLFGTEVSGSKDETDDFDVSASKWSRPDKPNNGYNTYVVNKPSSASYRTGYGVRLDPSNPNNTSFNTPGRIYVDTSALNTTITDIDFFNTDSGNDYLHYQNSTAWYNTTMNGDYYLHEYDTYNYSSALKKIFTLTIPWNAETMMITTSDEKTYSVALSGGITNNLLALRLSSNTLTGSWINPTPTGTKIGSHIYLQLNDSGDFSQSYASSIKARFHNNYYLDTYNPTPENVDAEEISADNVVLDRDGKKYLKFSVPDWATRLSFVNTSTSQTSSNIYNLAVTENVYYSITSDSRTIRQVINDNYEYYETPTADTARVFLRESATPGLWDMDGNYDVGVEWMFNTDDPAKIATVNYTKFRQFNDNNTYSSLYGYADIPKNAYKIRILLLAKNSSDRLPSHRGSTTISVSDSTFTNWQTISPDSNYSQFCTTTLNNNKNNAAGLGAPGSILLSKILEAYSTCSEDTRNGYGNGKELCENFYVDGASSSTLNTLAICRGGSAYYSIGNHFAALYNKDVGVGHEENEDVEGALAPYYAPNIEIQNSSNSTTLIVIICGVSAIALVSISLLLVFSKKKKSE